MADVRVVRSSNEHQVLFSGLEDDARDYVENNFPRHHVDPASPLSDEVVPDVYLVTASGKEMYLGPEHEHGWVKVGAPDPEPEKAGGKK